MLAAGPDHSTQRRLKSSLLQMINAPHSNNPPSIQWTHTGQNKIALKPGQNKIALKPISTEWTHKKQVVPTLSRATIQNKHMMSPSLRTVVKEVFRK